MTFFADFSGACCVGALKQSQELQLLQWQGSSLPTPPPQLCCSVNPLLNYQLIYTGEFSTGE